MEHLLPDMIETARRSARRDAAKARRKAKRPQRRVPTIREAIYRATGMSEGQALARAISAREWWASTQGVSWWRSHIASGPKPVYGRTIGAFAGML